MIQELVRLGEAVLADNESGVLEALIEDIQSLNPKQDSPPHLVVLDLRSEGRLEWRTEVLDSRRAEAYLWLGTPRANAPKVRVTTPRLDYLLGQTFYALTQDPDLPPELRARLERVFPKLFWHDPEARGSQKKYAYLLDVRKLSLNVDWEALASLPPKQRAGRLAHALTDLLDLPKQGVLYTLALDGEPLAQLPAYRTYMLHKIVEGMFAEAPEGVCHACSTRTKVNANFTHFKIKLFINDKLSFAYGLEAALKEHDPARRRTRLRRIRPKLARFTLNPIVRIAAKNLPGPLFGREDYRLVRREELEAYYDEETGFVWELKDQFL